MACKRAMAKCRRHTRRHSRPAGRPAPPTATGWATSFLWLQSLFLFVFTAFVWSPLPSQLSNTQPDDTVFQLRCACARFVVLPWLIIIFIFYLFRCTCAATPRGAGPGTDPCRSGRARCGAAAGADGAVDTADSDAIHATADATPTTSRWRLFFLRGGAASASTPASPAESAPTAQPPPTAQPDPAPAASPPRARSAEAATFSPQERRAPPWWSAAPFDEQLPRRRGPARRRWTDPSEAWSRCVQGRVSIFAFLALRAALAFAASLEPDPKENGIAKGRGVGHLAVRLQAGRRRQRRAARRRARALLYDAIALSMSPAHRRSPLLWFAPVLLLALLGIAIFALSAWTSLHWTSLASSSFVPALPSFAAFSSAPTSWLPRVNSFSESRAAAPSVDPFSWRATYISLGGIRTCRRFTCVWSFGGCHRARRRNYGRYDALTMHGAGVPYDMSFTIKAQLVSDGIEPNPGPSPGATSSAHRHRHPPPSAEPSAPPTSPPSVRGNSPCAGQPSRPRPTPHQMWGSTAVLALLGLRLVDIVGNGHCCVYSVAYHLGFPARDATRDSYSILDGACFGLRQEAHNILTTPGVFLDRCLVSYAGSFDPCCDVETCPDRKRRAQQQQLQLKLIRGDDGLPVDWTTQIIVPLLQMDPVPGYVGDHFIRALAICRQRDIVVLCTRSRFAKIYYADPSWFASKSSKCKSNPIALYGDVYDRVDNWDAFTAWFRDGTPIAQRAGSRMEPARAYRGHPFVIIHNGVEGGGAHYDSTDTLHPVGCASPSDVDSGAMASPASVGAVSAAPARAARADRRCAARDLPAAGRMPQPIALSPPAGGDAAAPARRTARVRKQPVHPDHIVVFRPTILSRPPRAVTTAAARSSQPAARSRSPPPQVSLSPPLQQRPPPSPTAAAAADNAAALPGRCGGQVPAASDNAAGGAGGCRRREWWAAAAPRWKCCAAAARLLEAHRVARGCAWGPERLM